MIFAYPANEVPAGAVKLDGTPLARNTYPAFYKWVDDSETITKVTEADYNAEIKKYGVCNAFVISDTYVRLPTWKGYQTPLGDSVPVKGNGMTLGLTNGTNFVGVQSHQSVNALTMSDVNYGKPVGSTYDGVNSGGHVSIGVTDDATKSGLIADTSGYKEDGFVWCIQVYNAITNLSELDASQLSTDLNNTAQKDFSNVTAPTQAFKDMSIDWGMPDYTAGVDITSRLTDANSEYTAPYDCMIRAESWNGGFGAIFSQPNCVNATYEFSPYALIQLGTINGIAGTDKIYCQKGMKIYCASNMDNNWFIEIYPLKGANK